MTDMPQFIEPREAPTDRARAIADQFGCPPEDAQHYLDVMAAATEGATTPEEAAAAVLAAAEQLGEEHGRACGCPPFQVCDTCQGVTAGGPGPDVEHDQEEAAAVPPMPAQAPPVPLYAGTYAIYDDGAGGVMLVVGQSTGEVVRKHIPAAMMKMAERFGGAGSGLAGLFGGR